jgi:hypothetical protein
METEVYLFDLDMSNGKPVLSNPKNISNNPGYDNQPSFWDDDHVLLPPHAKVKRMCFNSM